MDRKTPTILLVDDNDDHAELVKRSIRSNTGNCIIHHLHDGKEALDFFFEKQTTNDASTEKEPDLVLLDLRMPKVDGLEVLKRIKDNDQYSSMPVVILTTSSAEKDISDAYRSGANSYLVKPVNYDSFSELIKSLVTYWLSWNILPKGKN